MGRPASTARGVSAQADREAALLDVARAAARAAAVELLARYEHTVEGLATKTTATDPVSDADRAAEAAIRALLAERRPGDAILGEEGGETLASGEASGVRWVVDPLDGTVNYLFGYPQWSVSIAAEDAEGTIAGVVLDPLRDEEIGASRSGPLLRDGAPAAVGDGARPRATTLDVALVATGFAYDAGVRARQAEVLPRLLPRVRDMRRGGSAALDLAWTALGRVRRLLGAGRAAVGRRRGSAAVRPRWARAARAAGRPTACRRACSPRRRRSRTSCSRSCSAAADAPAAP